MDIRILTIFPEMFAPLSQSVLGRAQAQGLLRVETVDIRAFSQSKHRNTDDYPFGGGAGMVMMAQPILDAMDYASRPPFEGPRIYLSPRGETLTQRKAERLARLPGMILLCGHYEGVDQRALDACVDEEVSIGDYVLTGGELAAMVLVDCVTRLVPGVLGSAESSVEESFSAAGLLEYPQYTRPREIQGQAVPEVLLSGDHAKIAAWRREESLRLTLRKRPDLLARANLTAKEKRLLAQWEASEAIAGAPPAAQAEEQRPQAGQEP
ncbi:MAG TPA: tRNA (guanosine(37)-N1)-methyltransferase TrmD [Clostridia bacterium]|nr:tRNA (guanosine(37)-N1)-methyltransferase TrmD [Clostridia bacterium]